MLDYQHIVDDVRSSLYASGPEGAETVRAAAAAYAESCIEVNERLRRCNEMLKAGLRSEAIQQCEVEPNLLDVVATLDFPERDYWVQLLNQHGIAVPGPLFMDVAADLNEAYAIEQPLETLLDRHRVLALARSPLKLRIKTLRQLSEIDVQNPIWREDLIVFERERQRQVQREAANSIAAGDAVEIAKLDHELRSNEWQETPPQTLLSWVSEAREKLSRTQAHNQMKKLAGDLIEAHARFDDYNGKRLRQQWHSLASVARMQEGDPLWKQAAPSLEWLAQQDAFDQVQMQFDADSQSLETALISRAPAHVLERLYRNVMRHDQPLPERLESQYQQRIADLLVAARKRHRNWLVAGASAALIVLCTSGIIIFHNHYLDDVEHNATALKKLIDENKIDEAQQFLAKVKTNSPSILTSTEFNELSSRLDGLLKKDGERQKSFTFAIQSTQQAADGVNDWATLAQARKLLSDARHLSSSNSDKDDVKRVELQLATVERDLQKKEDGRFAKSADDIRQRLHILEKDRASDLNNRMHEIEKLRFDLNSLQKHGLNVSAQLRGQTEEMDHQLNDLANSLQSELRSFDALKQINQSVGNSVAFHRAITDFVASYPAASQCKAFKIVAEEAPLWDAVKQFGDLSISWRNVDQQSVSPSKAVELLRTAKALLDRYPDFPDGIAFRDRQPFLESIAHRVDDKGSGLESKLYDQFSKPWISNLWIVEGQDGKRYYCREKVETQDKPFTSIRCISDFDLSEKTVNIRSENMKIYAAPQSHLAKQAQNILDHLQNGPSEQSWEQCFADLAQAIYDDSQTDALLRFILLQQTLDIGCQGSKCIDVAYGQHRKHLNDAAVNVFANWLDPKDKEADSARAKALTALQTLPDFANARQKATELWHSLKHPIGRAFNWVGWLQRDSKSEWTCSLPTPISLSGDVFIIRFGRDRHSILLDRIGKADQGTVVLAPDSNDESFVEGRPVYIVETSVSK